MRASHVEEGLFAARDRKCRASLIIGCTTTTILERPRFRRRSPPPLPRPPADPPSEAAVGPRGIAETVNQRQGRVRGRGIGAARSSQASRRARRGCLGKYKRCSLVSEFGAGAGEFPPPHPHPNPEAEFVITSERFNGYALSAARARLPFAE